jgi:CP family cyanate transporter-like MFS transporter
VDHASADTGPRTAALTVSTPHGGGARSSERTLPGPRWLLVLALVLTALNLRTAVTSVGPLLDELESGLGLGSGLAGLLTTLPVLSFAALGAITPSVAGRLGERRTLAVGLLLMTTGLALRAVAGSPALFLLMSVLALVGGAMGNVLLPSLVKRHFPDRIGPMTAVYTTALATGTTLAAALTVPVSRLRGGEDWRLGLGVWAALAAVAVLPWLAMLRGDVRRSPASDEHGAAALVRSPVAWALAVFFGCQSIQAYVAFGWFAQLYRDAGLSAQRAGLLVAFLAALSIPVSMAMPAWAARMRSQRPLIVLIVVMYVVSYVGLLTAPSSVPWLWAALSGLGAAAFPLALTLIGLRTRTPTTTAALSAFAQSVGYLIAGTGPLLVGVLRGATGGWGWPFALLFCVLAAMLVAGWVVGRERYVEDDLARRRR